MFPEKQSRISKMSLKVGYSSCLIVLIYIFWLSEVNRLMMLNKFDFHSSLNLHHAKFRKYGLFLCMSTTASNLHEF